MIAPEHGFNALASAPFNAARNDNSKMPGLKFRSGMPQLSAVGADSVIVLKSKILLAVAMLTTGFASAATPRSQVHAYTVQGNVELKSIRYSTNDGSFYYELQTNHFEIQVRDCRWLVKLGTHDPKVFDYRIVSSDGASTYLLLSYETRQKINALEGKGLLPNVCVCPKIRWFRFVGWSQFARAIQ